MQLNANVCIEMVPDQTETVRWGILGPGAIATGFANAMSVSRGGTIAAVGSRSADRAANFADQHGVARWYGDYDALLADPNVDVVYVATPQSRHAADTIACLEAGKHVLCEKPFALGQGQARRMAEVAHTRGLFLMEAIWSRFLPAYVALVDVLGSGRIGDPLLVEADFGFRRPVDPEFRLFRRDLGGGGLLDLGIYPVQLCSLVLGAPVSVVAEGVIGETGVDEVVAAVLRHPNEGLGVVKAALRVGLSCSARIAGTEGVIEIPALMHCPESITVASSAGVERIDGTYEGNGLRFEIEEVHRCLAAGRTESAVMPLGETIVLASVLDDIRAQIGLVFDDEPPQAAARS
jgi:predicted dehydrogenase